MDLTSRVVEYVIQSADAKWSSGFPVDTTLSLCSTRATYGFISSYVNPSTGLWFFTSKHSASTTAWSTTDRGTSSTSTADEASEAGSPSLGAPSSPSSPSLSSGPL